MRVNIFHIVLWSLLMALLACKRGQQREQPISQQDTIPVKVISLLQQDVASDVVVSGYFTTNDETFLSFKNGGVISNIYVKEGDAIRKGQLLASINPTEIGSQVGQVQLAYQKAERDHNRAEKLYKDSVATLEQLQNAKTALEVARKQLDAAQFNQDYTQIRATQNGYVLKKLANNGQVVGPGMPVLQVNGAGQANWMLKVGLSDRQWAFLKIGDQAIITTDALPQQTLQAKLGRKAKAIDPQSGTFEAELILTDGMVKGLASGLFGKARISPSSKQQAYSIPYDALLDGGEGEGYVFVTDDNQTAKKVKVQLGGIQKDKVSIVGGLEGVNSVIVSGSAYLTDGAKIKVVN